MGTVVFLFDIDGVLVQPRGYRLSVQAAVRFLAGQMGWGNEPQIIPDEQCMQLFESQGITCEWDMVPICLAKLLDVWQAQHPERPLPPSLAQAFALTGASISEEAFAADYPQVILTLGPLLQPGEFPATAALRVSRSVFPHLDGNPLLQQVLGESRDIRRSYTTRLFQHFSLGSRGFEQTYGLPAQVESLSLLQVEDRPLLTPDLHRALVERIQLGQLHAAAYTARPSLPPREIPGPHPDYSPEAEMALALTGLEDLPAIGYGRLQYLAAETGTDPEAFLKPAPLQALAAIFSALNRQELSSLRRAYTCLFASQPVEPVEKDAHLPDKLPDQPVHLHVFEDSAGGITAVRRAAQVLADGGWLLDLHAWGISTHPQKRQALREAGAELFDSTDQALRKALSAG